MSSSQNERTLGGEVLENEQGRTRGGGGGGGGGAVKTRES